ncbi:valine--tRNA ligase [endosymbiont 'TC1' of Trimyema compressum]|uniref:valine--tRNA ligase n=1 Tax=endosymbiont 'TC1' of Trimyema compressum TaxID=243899 RepID=UPI0007F08ABA|nr:valine--tRNA ligase [endosymbiont 'TC1' of Trimyema compressum]AMP21418.1 valine--tRNA ligase [endosymbiont 'TC1' of Trimyema compressum]
MSSKYNAKEVESKWYPWWEKNGYFHQEVDESKEPFCIVMPPPNVTGQLHLGHAMDNTLQDILIRFKRMEGYNTLWVPGTDHAGIATQARVEEELKKTEGLTRQDLGREAFLEKVWNWKALYHKRITSQLRLLGSSCDWQRERFTLDDGCLDAVKEVFIRLYEKGLIYRGKYIVNWCPSCLTTISDIEVEHEDDESSLWHIRYPIDGTRDYITIATTRPETMLGDTAIAVAPDDERYQDYIGKFAILPLINRKIPIIADDYVDKSFGTGAVKITPSHDPNDFEIAGRHNLPQIVVIDQKGNMTGDVGKYLGMDRDSCRVAIVEDLEKAGFLISIEPHTHAVGKCYRCGTIIEPLVSSQWFVKMDSLAKRALEEVKKGEAKFITERFTKVYTSWLENIKDWCISRQLWWGRRIPVWYCEDCGEMMGSKESLEKCTKCNSTNIYQDPDVLDTWFSSALWPFSTLGWPEKTKELEQFYPTSVLVTGRDIIFFWVARMLFMGLEFMDKVPFKEIFIHGLILDSKGRKMSKSLGNGIDPIEIIENYGADTLRFMLVTGNTPGNDISFQKDRLEGVRNFCNKIWNASRFLMMNLEGCNGEMPNKSLFTLADKWILNEYNETIKKVTHNFDEYELGEGADTIYDFIWNSFCDWYIEIAKNRLYNGTAEEKIVVKWILNKVLIGSMKLLHPFMPFITEEIWQHLPHKGETIMLDSWPTVNEEECFITEKNQMESIMETIRLVRNIRAEINVPLGKKASIYLFVKNENEELAKLAIPYLETMANSEAVTIGFEGDDKPAKAATGITKKFEVYLPLEHLIDMSAERKRLEKELAHLEKEVQRIEKKLNNEGFVKKAPAKVIEGEKEKLAGYREQYNAVKERWEDL